MLLQSLFGTVRVCTMHSLWIYTAEAKLLPFFHRSISAYNVCNGHTFYRRLLVSVEEVTDQVPWYRHSAHLFLSNNAALKHR